MRHDQHAACPRSLAISARMLHDGLAVLAVQRGGRLVGQDDGRIADNGARNRDALLFAAAEFARIGLCLVGQTDLGQRLARLGPRGPGGLAAHIERQPHIVGRGQRRKQMIRLEHEADMLAPQLGQFLRPRAGGRMLPRTRTVPAVGVSMQPRMDSSVVLPLPEGPISSVSSPPLERQADALERATLAAPAAEVFLTIHGLQQRLAHRVNTMAGSMRVTFMIAAIAETTHITTVSRNSPAIRPGVMTIGSALRRGQLHHQQRRSALRGRSRSRRSAAPGR